MRYERYAFDDDNVYDLPLIGQLIYLAVHKIAAPGAVEVFIEHRNTIAAPVLLVRPSNVHGELLIEFGAEGAISDLRWEQVQ